MKTKKTNENKRSHTQKKTASSGPQRQYQAPALSRLSEMSTLGGKGMEFYIEKPGYNLS